MNQGGQFAQDLSVYIGGGQGATTAAASANGSINLDLSKSAVDSQSLGLQGVQAPVQRVPISAPAPPPPACRQILATAANRLRRSDPATPALN